jgi:hypothetical protein
MAQHLEEEHGYPITDQHRVLEPEPSGNHASADGSEAVARYDANRTELIKPNPPTTDDKPDRH